MDDILTALGEQQAELSSLLAGLDADAWHRPSPCEGWDVADVVLHLCQTNEMALASAEGRLAAWFDEQLTGLDAGANVDDGADALVAAQRGLASVEELRDRWAAGAANLHRALRAGDAHQRVDWVAGQLSLHTLATTRLAETWIHTGDVADALGVPLAATARLEHIARLAWRTLPYAFQRAGRAAPGPVAFELIGPEGEAWTYNPDGPAATVVRGTAEDLCRVAARRVAPGATALSAEGPDADAVLELVRTYA